MAPIAQPLVGKDSYDGSKPRFGSLQAWIDRFGPTEYTEYKKTAAAPHLSYEEWSASDHVLGPYLWYTTLDVWGEESSSDGDLELDAQKIVSRGAPEPKPKRRVTTNGHGMRKSAKFSASTTRENSEGPGGSPKRKRKPRKKHLSEEIVAADDSDPIDEPTTLPEAASPVTSTTSPLNNGRRKPGGRKKKSFLSEEIISPEDEADDPMLIDEVATGVNGAAAPSTLGNGRSALAAAASKAKPPKAKPGRKPKKKYLSAETVPLDDDENSAPADATTPNTKAASPESPGTTSSRRGLRIRTAAQERPYAHTAKLFEDHLSETEGSVKQSPKGKTTRLSLVSYPDEDDGDEALLNEGYRPAGETQSESVRKAHYKGKGRAWKKTEEDEDQDYRSPIKLKLKNLNPPKKKPGRRKSLQVLETATDDANRSEVPQQPVKAEKARKVAVKSPVQKAKQTRRPKRIHHLSEEFIRDDSDTEEVEEQPARKSLTETPSPFEKVKRPRGRPRKSEQNVASKDMVNLDDDNESLPSPFKKSEPQEKPRRKSQVSITPVPEITKEIVAEGEKMGNEVGPLGPLCEVRKRKSVDPDEENV